jgi:glycine C-acetyltransferase
MNDRFIAHLRRQIQELKDGGLYKESASSIPSSRPTSVWPAACGHQLLRQQCSASPTIRASSVRRRRSRHIRLRHGLCALHLRHAGGAQALEQRLARFLGMEDAILYGSCFDANGGLFETLLGEEDAVISDALNHASIIDGVRLSKAQRYRYANNDMADLEAQLKAAANARFKLIATDGVFSMDGILANLKAICDLAEKYGAMVMVDDSHAVSFVARRARRKTLRRHGTRRSHHRHARQASVAPQAATRWAGAKSSTGCATARAPTFFPTH